MGDAAAIDSDGPGRLPTTADDLLAYLEKLGVRVELHRHAPVFTVAESAPLKKTILGLHCRNLFLRDKKKKNFLVVAANESAVDLKTLQAQLGCDRLSFGSAERLWEYLGVRPGSVCPFAIINDKGANVEIFLDKAMMDADLVCYHPMENHLTVGLAPRDLVRFIESCNHVPHIIDLSAHQAAPEK